MLLSALRFHRSPRELHRQARQGGPPGQPLLCGPGSANFGSLPVVRMARPSPGPVARQLRRRFATKPLPLCCQAKATVVRMARPLPHRVAVRVPAGFAARVPCQECPASARSRLAGHCRTAPSGKGRPPASPPGLARAPTDHCLW